MDLFYQKAKNFAQETVRMSQQIAKDAAKVSQDFALETAKRSQEIAIETAKLSQGLAAETAKKSQQIALQTAKRSKELAVEATKKADEFKAFAGQLGPLTPSTTSVSETELQEYGITEELREFVRGLTIKTFMDFPLDDADMGNVTEKQKVGLANFGQDLTNWQERHAVLVLSTVKEISHFRYVLCPRRMQESRFWRIYFLLVNGHVARYEVEASKGSKAELPMKEEAVTSALTTSDTAIESVVNTSFEQDMLQVTKEKALTSYSTASDLVLKQTANTSSEEHILEGEGSKTKKPNSEDQDLDAYLMGDSSDDDGPDGAISHDSDVDL